MTSLHRLGMFPLRLIVLLLPLVALAPAFAADLKAAAALAGMTTGMAAGCDLDSKPVLLEFRALLDRSGVTQAEREKLNEVVTNSAGLGLSMQKQSGSMPCSEVKARMSSTINTLRTAR